MPVRMDPSSRENAEPGVRSLLPSMAVMIPAMMAVMACIAASGILTVCLYTTHHFNSGRILDPGQTAVTLGYGRARIYEQGCPDGWDRAIGDSNSTHCEKYDHRDPYTGVQDSALIRQRITSEP